MKPKTRTLKMYSVEGTLLGGMDPGWVPNVESLACNVR